MQMSKATKPVTLTEQGEGLWLKGRYTEATAIFTRVLGIAESPAALALRGDCYRMMKRHSDAMDDLNRALSLVQKKEFYFLRAHLFDDLGKSAEALADLDRALEIDRTFSKAVQFRESLLNRNGTYCRRAWCR